MPHDSPTMQDTAPHQHPKGILKNSFHSSPAVRPILSSSKPPPESAISTSPLITSRVTTDQDLTLQNTLQNAGHRRNSSANPRSSMSRRQSNNPGFEGVDMGDSQRLKWDEANLYLTEQEKSSTMKIDEPKTPYAKRYEPEEDEEEMRTLDAQDLVVDELDKFREGRSSQRTRDAEIPGLDIGEPEEDVSYVGQDHGNRIERSGSMKGEKQVVVDADAPDGKKHDGMERHRDFEEMRKKHYEMKDVKELLGHSAEELEAMDEDEDGPPPVPKLNQSVVNGA